jgi:hypothetical protein
MNSISVRSALWQVLLSSTILLQGMNGYAQTNSPKASPFFLPLPVSAEWNESLNPRAPNKLATDGFQFRGGTKNLKMQFSTKAPASLGGKQFPWMPGGYQFGEFSLDRKWGSLSGFRSLRYNEQLVRPDLARTLTGAGLEIPKSFLGTRLAAYFLHADPTREARMPNSRPNGRSRIMNPAPLRALRRFSEECIGDSC